MMEKRHKAFLILLIFILLIKLCGCNLAYNKEEPSGIWKSDDPYILLDFDSRKPGSENHGEFETDNGIVTAKIILHERFRFS